MTAKHTPGPWVARQEFSNRWRIEVPRDGFVPVSVAIVTTTVLEMGANDKDTGANARLIAAAPDLLAACEFALTTPGMIKGRDAMMKAVAAARGLSSATSTVSEG